MILFSNTVQFTVCFEHFTHTVVLLLVSFLIFGLLFCILFKNTVSSLLRQVRKLLFFVCVSINMQWIVCNIYCRVFKAVICYLLRAFEIACNAPRSSTMTRNFCVGLVHLNEQAEIKLRFFFFRNNFNFRGCAGVAATGGNRRAHHFTHLKDMLMLPDSNCITSAPNTPCCLQSRPPVSRLGNLHTLP